MNAHKLIAAEEIAALTAVSAGELLAQGASKGFPGPRRIVAILAFYGVLGWTASLGRQAARVSSAVGFLVMLLMLLGPAGFALEGLIGKLIGFAQTPAGAEPSAPAGQTSAPSGLGGALGALGSLGKSLLPPGFTQGLGALGDLARGAAGLFGGGSSSPSGPPGSAITGNLRVAGRQPGQVAT